ncbi:HAMP domain-containing histidine kinase [Draconibacterium sp.]|nr:HAMP domain-containing histidine kinase [Draconibacterium sp.]
MRTKRYFSKKRIIIYYLLVIVIPSCILGFLALSGIRNDQALIEREQRKKLAEYGTSIISEANARIAIFNNRFNEKIPDLLPSFPSSLTFEEPALYSFIEENNLIRSIFLIQPSDSIRIFHQSLLYLSEINETTEKEWSPYNYVNLFIEGWNYEFKEKDLQKTLIYYQKQLKEFEKKEIEGYILTQIARVQTKQSDYNKAKKTYQLIESEYGDITIDKRIHLGAMAQLEKSNISLLVGDTVSALNYSIEFLNSILNSEWQLDYSDYKNLLSSGNSIINQFKETNNEQILDLLASADTLFKKIYAQEKNTEYLFEFMDNSSLLVMNALNNSDYEGQFPSMKYAVIDDNSFYVSLFRRAGNQYWGVVFNVDEIFNELLLPLIREHSENENFQWQLFGERGEVIANSSNINFELETVIIESPRELPVWTIKLYTEPTGIINTLFFSGHNIFLFIFIFIALVLTFGLFFTIQIISNELQLSKMKSDFISTVSHEFKSPLTSIRHITDMLVFKRVPTESKKQEYYEIIQQQSERLSHLINNILDFSKLEEEEKNFRFEPVIMDQFLQEIVLSFKNSIPDKDFKVSYKQENRLPVINVDKVAITQVIHNLLDNAFKYSGDSDLIEVYAKSDKKSIIISVKDYGIGISAEDKDKIYSRFYRISNDRTQQVKGSGIGLTIVKQIIKYHGGTVSHESKVGSGSTFVIKLPIIR